MGRKGKSPKTVGSSERGEKKNVICVHRGHHQHHQHRYQHHNHHRCQNHHHRIHPIWKYVKCLMNPRLTCVKSSNPVESSRLVKRAVGAVLAIFFFFIHFFFFFFWLLLVSGLFLHANGFSRSLIFYQNKPSLI